MDRTTINVGPGMITWDGATIHVEDDIKMKIAPKLFEVATAGHGVVDHRREDLQIEVTATPKMWNDLAKLFPNASTEIGASIYGGTDKPLVIKPRTGTGWTIANAAITKPAGIFPASNKPILGDITWTGILANNGTGVIADYIATSAGGALTGFDLTKIPNGLYTAAWGNVVTGMHSEDGFDISFDLSLEDTKVDGLGVIDKTLNSLVVTCKFTPVGPTAQNILDIHGLTVPIGGSQTKNDLVITGQRTGLPIITLKNCIAQMSEGRTGPKVKRIGEMEFKTVRTATSGAIDALWTFGTAS